MTPEMSDSPGDSTSRRRRREEYYSDSEDAHSLQRDEHRSKREDDSDKDNSRRRGPDRRDPDSDRRYHDSGRRQDSDRKYDDRRERKYRDRSRSRDRSYHRPRSRSPPMKRRRRSESASQSPHPRDVDKRSRAPLPSQNESFRGTKGEVATPDGPPPVEKQKPNYKPTGLLAKEANTVAGTTTVLKYHEPVEARKPPAKEAWRMYVFKKKDLLDTIYLHSRSAWLLGRDEKVTDYLLEHPSVSKQHAVVQFRYRMETNEFGDKISRVKPYLLDLESANGTKLNGKAVEPRRYVELVDGDLVGFGESEREYVLMLPPAGE